MFKLLRNVCVAVSIFSMSSFSVADAKEFITLSYRDIIRVYDGDTFFISIPNTLPVLGENLGVRISGLDTPEIRSKCKTETAKKNEKNQAYRAKKLLIEQLKNATIIELTNLRRDKYFRLLAVVLVDGKDVSEVLISKGVAVKYNGEKKNGWCSESI
jgi:micrococcal nuclease